jgi:hypothetical protein
MGRTAIYSDEIADKVLAGLKAGKTLREVCREDGMPAAPTVIEWIYEKKHGDFAERYARAREIGYQQMADEILELADDGRNDWVDRQDGVRVANHEHITRSRLRFDARRWLLSKALPKIYGDKLAHSGPDGGPMQIAVLRFDVDKPELE